MNQNVFKVIFSKVTGQLVVVSEHTTAHGKAAAESTGSGGNGDMATTRTAFNPLSFALMLTLGTAVVLPAHAQIKADPSAPNSQQPVILTTASGATQVNIQTPTAAGVSINQYNQFDAL